MKSTFLKPLATLLILAFTIGCSTDTEESIELQDSSNTSLRSPGEPCANPDLLIAYNDHSFYYIYVEYEENATKQERNAIRNPYCDSMVSITPCVDNKNAEIWYVKGLCPTLMDCKPDVVKPTDPNLRLADFSNTCL